MRVNAGSMQAECGPRATSHARPPPPAIIRDAATRCRSTSCDPPLAIRLFRAELFQRLQTVEQRRDQFADGRMDVHRVLQGRIRRARRHDVDERMDRLVAFYAVDRRAENLLAT